MKLNPLLRNLARTTRRSVAPTPRHQMSTLSRFDLQQRTPNTVSPLRTVLSPFTSAPNQAQPFMPSTVAWVRYMSGKTPSGQDVLGPQDARLNDPTLAQFVVGEANGYLPREDPLTVLPERYAALEDLLQRMPLKLEDGSPGLLTKGTFGEAVETQLPLYDVSAETDSKLLLALFRDYTFVASAYLLEPCDLRNRAKPAEGNYGLGRQILPKQVAVPLHTIAEKIGAKPFMEYAMSYSLANYKRNDLSKPIEYDNLSLIRSFAGVKSEHGFILVHVAMDAHTGRLVKAQRAALAAVEAKDHAAYQAAMTRVNEVMQKINFVMETMWKRSAPEDYIAFRTFIMGTKSQPMFPNGVIYEGVSTEPTYFRGESGANDSIIPSMDNLLQLTKGMPNNPLTEILKDFRSYRPAHHNAYLTWLDEQASKVGVASFSMENPSSTVQYLKALDQVRDFRARHWNFTKEYILKHTSHPVATGGSPIVTWLPNQLNAVLEAIERSAAVLKDADLGEAEAEEVGVLVQRATAQRRILEREVAELKNRYKGQDI